MVYKDNFLIVFGIAGTGAGLFLQNWLAMGENLLSCLFPAQFSVECLLLSSPQGVMTGTPLPYLAQRPQWGMQRRKTPKSQGCTTKEKVKHEVGFKRVRFLTVMRRWEECVQVLCWLWNGAEYGPVKRSPCPTLLTQSGKWTGVGGSDQSIWI